MTRRRAALAAGIPLLVLLAGEIAARFPRDDAEAMRAQTHAAAGRVEASWRDRIEDAMRLATAARDRRDPATPPPTWLPVEGTGVLDPRGRWREWTGSPSDPGDTPPGGWRLVRRGSRASLVARSGADAEGGTGISSITLTAGPGGPRIEEGFDDALGGGALLRIFWGEPAAGETRATLFHPEAEEDLPGATGSARVALRLPDGTPAGTATIDPVPASTRRARTQSAFRAWAALAAVLLAGTLPWRRWLGSSRGLWAALGTIALARALLGAASSPERLLPRELGTASLFGSSEFGGLLHSPASLLATTAALLAAALAVRRFVLASGNVRPRITGPLSAAAAIACALATVELAKDLARDARLPLLGLESAWRTPAGAVLVLGLALAALAAAELAAAARDAWRRDGVATARSKRGWTAAALVPLAAAAAWAHAVESEKGDVERLRAEFAPQVRDQASLRRVALVSAVRDAAASPEALRTLADPLYVGGAYACWIAGDLFHQGFASSLDLLDDLGALRSHFAFGTAAVRDAPWTSPPSEEPAIREEQVPLGAVEQRLIHAEMPVRLKGRRVGTVVGHVLEEPDNLPFLPWIAPYLAALRPGLRSGVSAGRDPDYALYDADGNIVIDTLPEAPPLDTRIRAAASGESIMRLEAGADRFVALPLRDGGRTHLLLVRRRSLLDLCVGFVRLLLPALAVLALVSTASVARHAGGWSGLVGLVRGSFRRKLLASVLAASIVPLVVFSLFLRGYLERRAEAGLAASAASLVGVVERVIEDYAAVARDDTEMPAQPPNDEVLGWLRRVVGQEIHLYEDGVLAATSKPELFESGLIGTRLPGEIDRDVLRGGRPFRLRREPLGPTSLPVAYARVDLPGPGGTAVVGVPLILQQRDVARATERVEGMLLLTTVLLAGTLALVAAALSRAVADPVRAMVDGTARLAAGDYATRLQSTSRDELGRLVAGFNAMAEALAAQRADLVRRRDYIEALLSHATTGVVSTDSEGRVVTFNPAADALLSPAGALLATGEPLGVLISRSAGLSSLSRELAAPIQPDATPAEVDIADAARPRRLRVVRVPLPDPLGSPAGVLILLDDVTELMRSNQLAAWAEMARAIAHEIKNPLTPIQLSAEHLGRLLGDRGGAPPDAVRSCLSTILKQVRELREIAAEFSAYAKLPALSLVPLDPAAFVRETLAPYRAAPPEGLEIRERYAETAMAGIDRRVLGRALVNLVENALQALQGAPHGGILTVSVEPTAEGGCVIAVEDTGIGLSDEAHAHLFEPYFSTKGSGTGLGLAIVRRAVEAHGGRVEVSPPGGPGARFALILPPGPPRASGG